MKYKILHNPKCSKSKLGLQILKDKSIDFEILNYLEKPLSLEELKKLQKALQLKPIQFTRTSEEDFKNSGLYKDSPDEEILKLMETHPKIIERPIIILGDTKAIVGRPPELILNFVK